MKRNFLLVATLLTLWVAASVAQEPKPAGAWINTAPAGKRVGIIGLDTSHAPTFTKSFNAAEASPDLQGYRVVAAYPIGSRDIKSSVDRRDPYTQQLAKMGVEIVDSIPALIEKVDCVLLESNDGRVHLEQALPALKARKTMFIDKPIAASLTDALAIFRAADQYQTPVFTASSLRWLPGALELRGGSKGKIIGVDTFSPSPLEPTHPDLYWYGIHGVELLYTLMGPGCRQVTRFHNDNGEFCVGEWPDSRLGTVRGLRNQHEYGGTVYCEKSVVSLPQEHGYDPLLKAIAEFFESGRSPVAREEMIEIYAFMTAADASKAQQGRPVKLADVLEQARAEAEKIKID